MTPVRLEEIRKRFSGPPGYVHHGPWEYHDGQELLAEVDRLREVLEGIRAEAAAALHSVAPARGMHVPYFGPWAATVRTPSGASALRALVREATTALEGGR